MVKQQKTYAVQASCIAIEQKNMVLVAGGSMQAHLV